jgi:hypothetical protein
MTEEIQEYLRRESARKRKMMGRFRGERKQVLDGRKGKNDEERKTIEHMWNGWSEMRQERERKGEKYGMKTEER